MSMGIFQLLKRLLVTFPAWQMYYSTSDSRESFKVIYIFYLTSLATTVNASPTEGLFLRLTGGIFKIDILHFTNSPLSNAYNYND